MKIKNLTLCFLVLGIMLMTIASVSAAHTSSVAISPSGWLKPNTATTFSVSVSNNGPQSIKETIIDIPLGFSNLACGTAPTGWNLIFSDSDTCQYRTTTNLISSGNSKQFTINAKTSSVGEESWFIVTRDEFNEGSSTSSISTVQTIQNAITTASVGSTITVPAGTYTENLAINKKVVLQGAGRDVVTIIGTHTITANDVTVDGFKLQGVGLTVITIDDTTAITGGTISNNIITGGYDGIRVGGSGASHGGVRNVEIKNNIITGNSQRGIRFYDGIDYQVHGVGDIIISDNEITSNNKGGISTYGPGPNTITNNIVENNNGNGISIKYDNGDVISGNTVTGNAAMGINMHQVTNTVVENNIVTGHVSEEVVTTFWGGSITAGKGSAIYIHEASHDNIIRLNTLTGNKIGVLISREPASDGEPSSNSINKNKITDNTYYGIQNALVGPSSVNATLNWWGNSNPNFVTIISGSVNHDPWLYCNAFTQCADTTSPTITFVDAPYFTNGEITIKATITDDRGIANYIIDFGDASPDETVIISTSHNTSVSISKVHTYAESGDYTISLTATDESGNVKTATTIVKVITPDQYDWVIQLKTGWNLISIPYTLEDSSIGTVFEKIRTDIAYEGSSVYTIFQYDAVSGTWYKTRPLADKTGFLSTGTLTQIKPGYAYWIKMSNDAVLYGKKKASVPNEVPLPSVNLATGKWNLVGRYGVGTDDVLTPTNAFVYDLKDNFYEPVLKYTGKTWSAASFINTYNGYWLRTKLVSGQSQIAYEPGAYYF